MAATSPALLETEDLQKWFPLTRSIREWVGQSPVRTIHAVDGVSLSLRAGETLALIGESGSGKTTYGWLVTRLHDPTGGKIRFEGVDVTQLTGLSLRRWRQNIQIVFQDPVGSLDPRLKVWQIVGEPLRAKNVTERQHAARERRRLLEEHARAVQRVHRENRLEAAKLPKGGPAPIPKPLPTPPELPEIPPPLRRSDVRRMVEEVLPKVGLPPDCIYQYPHEFSGGGRQRLSLARALIVNPKLVILDEPTSALDVAVQAQILNRLVELQRERGLSYLLITHNMAAVRFLADRVAVLYLGQLIELGPTQEVLHGPIHPYTKALLAAVPVPDVRRRHARYRIRGEVPTLIDPKPGCRFAPRCPFVVDRCRVEDPPLRSVPVYPGRLVACHRAEEIGSVAPEAFLTSVAGPSPPPEDPTTA